MAKQLHFDGDALRVSRYFKRFERLTKEFPRAMELKGDQILVEKLPQVELKTKAGLIIGTATTHRNTIEDSTTEFGVVLMVGPGQFDETGQTIPCDSKPGDVVLLPGSTYWYGAFGHIADYDPYSIGRIRDSLIPMWFGDYQLAFKVLNESPEVTP